MQSQVQKINKNIKEESKKTLSVSSPSFISLKLSKRRFRMIESLDTGLRTIVKTEFD